MEDEADMQEELQAVADHPIDKRKTSMTGEKEIEPLVIAAESVHDMSQIEVIQDELESDFLS